MNFDTKGIVLYEQSIGEKDKLITVLTEKSGIVRAFVRGAKRVSSTKSSATQQFCYSDFSIYTSNDKSTINNATPIEVFFNLHKNIEILALGQYFCELSLAVVPRNGKTRDFLRLILNALHFIANTDRNIFLIKAVFELKIISMAGYMPNLVACKKCSKYSDEAMFFCFDDAYLYCKNCMEANKSNAELLPFGVITAMRHIIYSDFCKIFNFKLSDKSAKLLSQTSEKYVIYTLNRKFNSLEFFNNLY